jgi:hypothetical protein
VPSPENPLQNRKRKLVLAVANGMSIADWSRENKVPERTAYRWAREPKVRAAVEVIRRRAVDRTVGQMTHSLEWVREAIFKLAKSASSESVQLAALRSVTADLLTVSKFGGLQDRVTQIEEMLNARTGDAG